MKKILFLIMALTAIPAFAVKVTTDGKHNLEKAAGKYENVEIFQKNGKWYVTRTFGDYETDTAPILLGKNGKFSADYQNTDKETYAYDTKMKTLVTLAKNDTDQILFIELPEKTKATVDTNFNMNKVKGYWCDQLFEIVQKNGKWYLHGEDDGGWDELITVAKNGFTVEYGTKDTGDDRRFTFDTKLQTMVEIDKDGNIILPFILKDYCPTGYN